MATTEPIVVSANIVLVGVYLLEDQDAFEAFRTQCDPDLLQTEFGMVTEIPSGVVSPSRRLNLNRDRIVLDLSSSRSTIVKDYPTNPDDLVRLSEIAWSAIQCSELGSKRPRAFGYNIELVYDQDSAKEAVSYLGTRLFRSLPLGRDEWTLTGGTGQLILSDSTGRRWTINARPRPGDDPTSRVFLGMNLHYSDARVPSQDDIKNSLNELWDECHRFVAQLDELTPS